MSCDYKWLSVSFFADIDLWHRILNRIVAPLLVHLKKENLIKSYLLEINYLNGENIRFAILSDDENQRIIELINFYSDNFCSNERLDKSKINIIYNLYTPAEPIEECKDCRLSSILLKVLQQEEVNEEVIIALAFYLYIALIKTIINDNPTRVRDLLQLYPLNESSPFIDDLRLKFEESKQGLMEIYNDIINGQDLPDWVNRWVRICRAELEKGQSSYPITKSNLLIFNRIVYLIYKHLGINENRSLLLSYFIRRVLLSNSSEALQTKA